MTASTYAIIDCETTGIGAEHEVIELGLILCEHNSTTGQSVITSRYCGRREPKKRISPRAKALHGLSKKDLKGLVLDRAAVIQIIQSVPVLIAHNARFDREYVGRIFPEVHAKVWRCSLNDIDWQRRGFQKRTLIDLAAGHGVTPSASHRADVDCETLFNLLHQSDRSTGTSYITTLLRGGEPQRIQERPKFMREWRSDGVVRPSKRPGNAAAGVWWIIVALLIIWFVFS